MDVYILSGLFGLSRASVEVVCRLVAGNSSSTLASPTLACSLSAVLQWLYLAGFAARMSGTSAYRGVSWHTQTSRWKAQIKVAGKDVNLGRHKDELEAARAYDRAAICARGEKDAKLNFSIDDYAHEISSLTNMPLADLAASLRGVEQRLQAQTSRYHGVRLNKRTHKWEAYIRVAGKHVHLGCYDSEVAAAQAFDQAALVRQAHSLGAMGGKPQLVTNFPPMIYLVRARHVLSESCAASAMSRWG